MLSPTDLVLKLIDLFLKLLDRKGRIDRDYFEQYVRPSFEAAETIFRNYHEILGEVRKRAQAGTPPDEIVRYLEDRRSEHLATRIRVRAILRERGSVDSLIGSNPRNGFEIGIWGLLLGGAGAFEEDPTINNSNPYARQSPHTILATIYARQTEDDRYFLFFVNSQLATLETAWKDVSEGYAKISGDLFPNPKRLEPRSD